MRNRILKVFCYHEELTFSEIEKKIGERSNKLSYHLKELLKDKTLTKNGNRYALAEQTESQIPQFSEQESALPVVLLLIKKDAKHAVLVEREKRPFYKKLGLPGGRLRKGESLTTAVQRIAQKWNISCTMKKIHSVSLEHVTKDDTIIHSFVLITIIAEPRGTLTYTDITQHKDDIIRSDYAILQSRGSLQMTIQEVQTPHH